MGEAANGKDAMDQIEKLQPQIVISDVVMPLMDGVDFTVAVHHRYPHIQMIILSGYDNFEYVKQTLMQGVVDYILKPTLTPHELLGVLQKAAARIPGWHPDHAMTGETAEVLIRRASSSLFCRKVLQTELWGLSKDKTTCQIPWVFRISVKSETHGFCI